VSAGSERRATWEATTWPAEHGACAVALNPSPLSRAQVQRRQLESRRAAAASRPPAPRKNLLLLPFSVEQCQLLWKRRRSRSLSLRSVCAGTVNVNRHDRAGHPGRRATRLPPATPGQGAPTHQLRTPGRVLPRRRGALCQVSCFVFVRGRQQAGAPVSPPAMRDETLFTF
jgi:hypothetical protein